MGISPVRRRGKKKASITSFHFVSAANRRARRKGGKPMPRTPTRDELAALDKALPFGLPWRDAVLSGQPYPPPGGAPAPATCEIPGDRGRLYPGIYFARTTHGKRQCIDCHHAYLLEKRINFARWCALDGATDGHQTPQTRAEAEAYYSVFAPEEESPSAAAIEALRNAVPTREEGGTRYIVEGCDLPSEDIEDLRAYAARGIPEAD